MDAKYFPAAHANSFCSASFCAGSQIDMRAMTPLECDQCVTECDAESCAINLENERCTDRCLVVPCEEQCLNTCDSCYDFSRTICDSNECQGFFSGLTSVTSAIPVNPDAALVHRSNVEYSHQPFDWKSAFENPFEAFPCACNACDSPHYFRRGVCAQDRNSPAQVTYGSASSLLLRPSPLARTSTPSSPVSALFSPVDTSTSLRSTPETSTGRSGLLVPSLTIKTCVDDSVGYRCLWEKCGLLLPSAQDLASHVTAEHLNQYFGHHHGQPTECISPVDLESQIDIPCLWNNCNFYYPLTSSSAGPSTSKNIPTDGYSDLVRHIQENHLRTLSVSPVTAQATIDEDPSPPSNLYVNNILPYESAPAQASKLFCCWNACSLAHVAFASSAELTQHLTDAHVGLGNSRYHCYWADCHRHGEFGFSSKQKILRHIQSHTGYRPFKCELCDQYFSEAATLQQHMRRHTKEKPFICPEPGCGKAFAIAGALTIHRRVHTGSKPFKCKFCDRSFSESSNLSKHIRTHTGDRPYSCNFPGCEKRFARPDQVARHRVTHEKKKMK